MFYPLCGWIAEIFASNFKMIKWSYVFHANKLDDNADCSLAINSDS